jgi:predicted acylesterase/phospholipase RssA
MTDTTDRGESPAPTHTPSLECDIVMAGGVTSGIIYPGAIAVIARRYVFRSIGGTSVGAMAAAATAAAEYGRITGKNPNSFDAIATLAQTLSDAAADGHSRLFHLFTPEPGTRPLLALVTPLFGGGGFLKQAIGIIRATIAEWRIALPVALTVLAALWMLAVLFSRCELPAAVVGVVAALTLILVVWAVALIWMLAKHWLPALRDNGYGICTGLTSFGAGTKPGQPAFEGLNPWMHRIIQQAAGRNAADAPMTFGDLWGAALPDGKRQDDPTASRTIDLSMVASDISRNRTLQLPFLETPSPIYVKMSVLRRYLPADVAEWMISHPGTYDPRIQPDPGVIRLPMPHDLPLVFAARLSLSFPVLMSAFPLMTPDFTAEKDGLGRLPLRSLWLSDGGLTSNFPIHFFDSPVPARPTFCLNLIDYDAATSETAVAAATDDGAEQERAPSRADPSGGARKPIAEAQSDMRKASRRRDTVPAGDPPPGDEVWGFISTAHGNWVPPPPFVKFDAPKAGPLSFITTLLNTARFWNDNQMVIAPGFRDRVVNIALRDDEGGLNLDMPAKTIADLDLRGRAAGLLISARYDPTAVADPETGLPNQEIFANHRWVRFRNFMAAFEDITRRFTSSRQASDRAAGARGEPQLEQMIAGKSDDTIGYHLPASAREYCETTTRGLEDFALAMAEQTRLNPHATFDMPRTFGPGGVSNPAGAAPRPKMRFRLRPLVDNDPHAEAAALPQKES